jgi:hypothetical protein
MPRKTRELKVTVTFESNRLEEQNINLAYELVFPIKQSVPQRTVSRPIPKKLKKEKIQHQLQILSAVSNL